MRITILAVAAALLTAACAPSPFYVDRVRTTPGEIPRDAYGQPVWSVIPPPPPGPQAATAPEPRAVPILPIPGTESPR